MHRVRIIGGTHKSRSIHAPANLPVRPTTDFAKESLFNILNNHFDFESIAVLDLFSGTGSISFEFASRGTTNITCVDSNYNCISFIKKAKDEFGFDFIKVIKSDAFSFIGKCDDKFDLIFVDPPFSHERMKEIPSLVLSKNLLNPEGWLIVEHGRDTNFENEPHFDNCRKYSNVNFSIFKI